MTEEKYSVEFSIPGLPKTTNVLLRRSGSFVSQGNARSWKRQVGLALLQKARPRLPLIKFKLTLVRRNYRALDYDSLVACFKPLIDGLREHGIIKNDGWANSGPWHVDQQYAPKDQPHVYVKVEEV